MKKVSNLKENTRYDQAAWHFKPERTRETIITYTLIVLGIIGITYLLLEKI